MAANMAAMQKNVADLNAVWVQATPTSFMVYDKSGISKINPK